MGDSTVVGAEMVGRRGNDLLLGEGTGIPKLEAADTGLLFANGEMERLDLEESFELERDRRQEASLSSEELALSLELGLNRPSPSELVPSIGAVFTLRKLFKNVFLVLFRRVLLLSSRSVSSDWRLSEQLGSCCGSANGDLSLSDEGFRGSGRGAKRILADGGRDLVVAYLSASGTRYSRSLFLTGLEPLRRIPPEEGEFRYREDIG